MCVYGFLGAISCPLTHAKPGPPVFWSLCVGTSRALPPATKTGHQRQQIAVSTRSGTQASESMQEPPRGKFSSCSISSAACGQPLRSILSLSRESGYHVWVLTQAKFRAGADEASAKHRLLNQIAGTQRGATATAMQRGHIAEAQVCRRLLRRCPARCLRYLLGRSTTWCSFCRGAGCSRSLWGRIRLPAVERSLASVVHNGFGCGTTSCTCPSCSHSPGDVAMYC